MITVIGLGVTKGDLTARGAACMSKADYVVFRTALTASANGVFDETKHISLDSLYSEAEDFDALNKAIAARLKEYCAKGSVAYMVDGSGVNDSAAALLKGECDIRVIPGISAESSACAVTAEGGETVGVSATAFVEDKAFYAPRSNLLVKEVDNKFLAGEVKLKLIDLYGADSDLYYIDGVKAELIKVEDADRRKKYGYGVCFFLPYKGFLDKSRFNFADLMEIVYRLRGKDGCPWDKVQTHQTIRQNCIEEAYELVEAVNLEDADKMQEETGDVLLQGVFHAVIAEDCGEFSTTDVLTTLCAKLIFRHTHIFGAVKAKDAQEALSAWEAAKAKEKKQGTYSDRMEQVAELPALIKAEKIQRIAAKANFDWADVKGALLKLHEEIEELFAENADKEEEGGDLLFSAVNVLRHLGIEPEMALLGSVNKFKARFEAVEKEVLKQGKDIKALTLDELDAIYNTIKNADNR